MKTSFESDGFPAPDSGQDAVERTKQERYHQSARSHESREAELGARLQARQQRADELRQRHLSRLDALQKEYQADRTRSKRKLEQAEVRLEAAHHAAEELCGEIGVQYKPGVTSDEDILHVPRLEDAEAARRLDLSFGPAISDRAAKFFKPILTLLCWIFSALSLGMLFRLITPRDIVMGSVLEHPLALVMVLAMGGLVAFAVMVAVTGGWKALGTKAGAGRPPQEVRRMLVPVVSVSAALFLGVACLDARAAMLLNAARAALDPAYGVPMGLALVFGCAISGAYVVSLAVPAFIAGYNAAARKAMDSVIAMDGNAGREALRRQVPVHVALEALAAVQVAEEIIRALENDLDCRAQEFKRSWDELAEALPELPTTLEPEEAQELADLRHRVRSAKAHHDAYLVSRAATDADRGTDADHTD